MFANDTLLLNQTHRLRVLVTGDSALPEQNGTATATIRNRGDGLVRIVLTASGDWEHELSQTVLWLAAGAEQDVTLRVAVPARTLAGTLGGFMVNATDDDGATNEAAGTVEALQYSGARFNGVWDALATDGVPGSQMLSLVSESNGPQEVSLEVHGDTTWEWTIIPAFDNLGAWEAQALQLLFQPPYGTPASTTASVMLQCWRGGELLAEREFSATVLPEESYSFIAESFVSVEPGDSVELPVEVWNYGNVPHNARIVAVVPGGWLPRPVDFVLSPRERQVQQLTLFIPSGVEPGVRQIELQLLGNDGALLASTEMQVSVVGEESSLSAAAIVLFSGVLLVGGVVAAWMWRLAGK